MGVRRTRGQQRGSTGAALPEVNSSVELLRYDWAGPARSRVEDAASGSVVISRPSRAGSSLITARPGDVLVLAWTTEQAMFEVPVAVAEIDDGEVPTWLLNLQENPQRRQRRGAFRLDVALSAQFGSAERTAGLAQIHDLSEGGLRCTPPDGCESASGDEVWVELSLPEATVKLSATVVRVSANGEVGLKFQGVEEATAEQLRSYLFSEQLARRAKLAT